MKKTHCFSDQDLTLYYYGEHDEPDACKKHLDNCPECAGRYAAFSAELAQLPGLDCRIDDHAGTRMAAKVSERLQQPRRRSWLPALGLATAATLALVITLTGSPQPDVKQLAPVQTEAFATLDIAEDMPDIEFLEDLELLKELEILAQLEGV